MKMNTYEVKGVSKFGLKKSVVVHAKNADLAIKAGGIYREISECVAVKIGELDSEKFITAWDSLSSHKKSGYAKKQFENGLSLKEYDYIYIRGEGAWGSFRKNRVVTAYETIGLHACTKDLLEGMMESETPIIDIFKVL